MKRKLFVAFISVVFSSVVNASGVQLSTTRIVLKDGETKASYGLTNHANTPILASATISNFDGSPSAAFVVSPSLYQVQPKKTNQGQIVLVSSLPQNKESVFWLTVKTVNSESNETRNTSTMHIALAQSIKVFYRPKGLGATCKTSLKDLNWQMTKDGIKASNASKISFSIVNVKDANNKIYKVGDTIMPLSDKEWKVDHKGVSINSFTYVDEYGNYLEQSIKKL